MTKRLTTQTTHRCVEKGCTYAATHDCTFHFQSREGQERDLYVGPRCTEHAIRQALAVEGQVDRWQVTITPTAPTCHLCEGKLNARMRCVENQKNHRWLMQGFSCTCAICTVYGGDCWRSAAYDAAWETTAEHARYYEALKDRCPDCYATGGRHCDSCISTGWLKRILDDAEALSEARRIEQSTDMAREQGDHWSSADNYFAS